VREANQLKGSYVLEELDGTPLKGTYAGNRLKKFVKRDQYWYSPDDEEAGPVEDADYEQQADEEDLPADQQNQETTQEIEKSTGIVVRVPLLSATEREKYVRYEEDWQTDSIAVRSEED